MKIVLSWVFEHIITPFDRIDVSDVVKQLSAHTAEIESVTTILRKQHCFSLVKVQNIEGSIAYCVDESGKSFEVYASEHKQIGAIYLIFFDDEYKKWRFAHSRDLGASREFVLPALNISSHINATALLSEEETIITIDNNAIAHRPDLWSHRGIAREIAAIYGYELKSIETIITQKKLVIDPVSVSATHDSHFSITLEDKHACSRFAGLFIKSLRHQASFLDMVARLSLVDCRAINAIIDCTNYVLFDLGQPLHAYDADVLTDKRLVVRYADRGSELLLLDGETVQLSHRDIIVADGLHPISVAGIMGGHETGVTEDTKSIFVESACFDSISIRETTKKLGKRTESALRFSRGVDQNQNVFGIMRFLYLLDVHHISYIAAAEIQSAGLMQDATIIGIMHDFIEKRIGTMISETHVVSLLSRLGFHVEKVGLEYYVTVPTFRSKKDISIPEDIVEEVARLFGYGLIETQLPKSVLAPKPSVETIRIVRELKNVLSFGFKMKEVHTYSVFDESFLNRISYNPDNSVFLKNPISENRKRLVTSLVPHMLEAVLSQKNAEEALRFYEIARVWHEEGIDRISEKEILAGIFFDKKISQDFYDFKAFFERIIMLCNIDVLFVKNIHELPCWYDAQQVACMTISGNCIGHIGKLSKKIIDDLFDQKTTYVFECELLPFVEKRQIRTFKEISKFPTIIRDLSLMLSHKEVVTDIQALLCSFSDSISDVFVIDVFEKREWYGERAVTFRLVFQDNKRTLLSEEVDIILETIQKTIQTKGIQIR